MCKNFTLNQLPGSATETTQLGPGEPKRRTLHFALRAMFVALAGLLWMSGIAAAAETPAGKAKPPEAVAKEFFTYLLGSKHDIGTDQSAQARWLTASVRQKLAEANAAANKAAKAHPGDEIDSPSNGTFLDAQDNPTSFEVEKAQIKSTTALVDIICHWGPGTQYAGDKRTMTITFTLENDAWRVADIRTHPGKFTQGNTLLKSLQDLKKQ